MLSSLLVAIAIGSASKHPSPNLTATRRFEANLGQWPAQVRFLARTPHGLLALGDADASLTLRGASGVTVRLAWNGTAREATGAELLPGVSNYLVGDRSRWRRGVRGFGRVRYHDVAPSVDLDFYGATDGFEYDVVVRPGGDPRAIALQLDGVTNLRVEADGSIVLETSAGTFRQHRPIAFQERDGVRTSVDARYDVRDGRIRFLTGAYDRSRPLVIDPTIDFSTYLGGSAADVAKAVATDSAGNIYVTGRTASVDFPTASPLQTWSGGTDAFVAKLSSVGQLVYSTYLGGTSSDETNTIAVNGAGSAYVGGSTYSTDFPLASPFQATMNPGGSGFVARLAPDGSSLIFSTYFGGSVSALAVDGSGAAYLTGAPVANLPLQDAFQTTPGRSFVAKLSATGTLVYSTYFGGTFDVALTTCCGRPPGVRTYGVILTAIAADSSGAAYVGGFTTGQLLPPSPGAFQTAAGQGPCTSPNALFLPPQILGPIPCSDGVVVKLLPSGALGYATYLGNTASERDSYDFVNAIAVDTAGVVTVAGTTLSASFPTTPGAMRNTCSDALCKGLRTFVARLNPAGSALVMSAVIGSASGHTTTAASTSVSVLNSGEILDVVSGGSQIGVDALGQVSVTGTTQAVDFPQVNALQPALTPSLQGTNLIGTWGPLTAPAGMVPVSVFHAADGTALLTVRPQGNPAAALRLYKSTDQGAAMLVSATWSEIDVTAFGGLAAFQLAADPNTAAVLYTERHKTTDGGASWSTLGETLGTPPRARPGAANILFALNAAHDRVRKSVDGGAGWGDASIGIPGGVTLTGIRIVDSSPDQMFAFGPNALFITTNGGASWSAAPVPDGGIFDLAILPANPSLVYAASPSGLRVRATDGTWNFQRRGLSVVVVTAANAVAAAEPPCGDACFIYANGSNRASGGASSLSINPIAPLRMLAVSAPIPDGFVATLAADGSGLVFSSPIGGSSRDNGTSLAVSADGGIVVAGQTESADFPTLNAIQPSNAGGATDGFVAKVRFPQVLMGIGTPVDHATAFMPFKIGGWAVDRGSATDSGIDAVHVWAFSATGVPTFLGAVTPSVSRPDVAAWLGPQFGSSGFNVMVDGLAPGPYTLAIYPHSRITSTFAPPQVMTVTVATGGLIAIGVPANGATAYGGTKLGGWAIDRASTIDTGVSTVHVYAYPNPGSGEAPIFLGVADYGVARPDVGAIFGSQFTNSGFNLYLPPLTPGPYLLVAFPFSTMTNAFLAPATVTVTIGPSRPNGALNPPADHAIVSGGFLVGGWAIDQSAPSGPGVDAVHVYAFPTNGAAATFLGVAQYGISRPDVGAIFGSEFTPSGYMLNAPALPPGTYDVYAFSRSTVAGSFNFARAARITVQ
jgi:hypothetical protein